MTADSILVPFKLSTVVIMLFRLLEIITRIARNASNKLQLKEKQAVRVCLLHPV